MWEAILKRAKQKEDARDLGKAAVAARKMSLLGPSAFFAFLFEPQAYQAHVTRSNRLIGDLCAGRSTGVALQSAVENKRLCMKNRILRSANAK